MKLTLWCIVLSMLALRVTNGCQGGCQQHDCCGGCRSSCTTMICMQSCCSSCCCSTSTQPITPPTGPTRQPPQPPPSPSNSNVNNNINASLDVTINNHINVENRVYVPISINNSNVQSVSIVDEENCTYTGKETICPSTSTSTSTVVPPPIWNTTTTQPTPITHPPYIIIRIPVPYPIYKRYPVPVPYPIYVPYPDSHGCCTVIRPCVIYGCQSYRQHCGSGCLGRVMYEPINPCHGGCHKRSWGSRNICWGEQGCSQMPVDCNGCNSDFFETYGGFQKCGGCYSGIPIADSAGFNQGDIGGYGGIAQGGGGWRR